MIERKMKKIYFVLILAGLLVQTGFTQMTPVSLEEQLKKSTAVIEGEVVGERSFWDDGRKNIYTAYRIKVFKSFKGNITDYFVDIVVPGGQVGLNKEVVYPRLELQKGDIGLFTLSGNSIATKRTTFLSHSHFNSFAATQSFYKYDLERGKVLGVFEKFSNIKDNFISKVQSILPDFHAVAQLDYLEPQPTSLNPDIEVMSISGVSPTMVNAGTQTIITITGNNFGSTKGSIRFANADNGGSSTITALNSEILSWTNTQIKVQVPSKAGDGNNNLEVRPASGGFFSSTIDIGYSIINIQSDAVTTGTDVAYRAQHVDDDNSGGYTWQMNSAFASNTPAVEAFTRSLDLWKCASGINWKIGSNTTVDTVGVAADGINIVMFDDTDQLPSGVLGRNTSRFSGCFNSGNTDIDWIISELDINFDSQRNWNFDPGAPASNEFDFESVASHELGHGHQHGHVIDNSAMMHYSIAPGVMKRTLSQDDLDGAIDVMNLNTGTAVCSRGLMTAITCVSASCRDITIQLDATGNATISTADVDNGSIGTNISIDKTSFTCADVGPNTVTLTADDGNGNQDTCISTVTVEDGLDPTAVCQDLTLTLNATGTATISVAQIDNGSSDNCGIASMVLDRTDFDCSNIGVNTVLLTVTDYSGNTGKCNATVTVQDNGCANNDDDGDGVINADDTCPDDPGPPTLDGCPLAADAVSFTVTDPSCPGKKGNLQFDNQIATDLPYSIDGIDVTFNTTGTFSGNTQSTVNNLEKGSYWLVLNLDNREIFRARFNVIEPDVAGIFTTSTTTIVAGRTISFELKPGISACQIPDYAQLKTIKVYNSVGQLIDVLPFKEQFEIPAAPSGIYMIQIVDMDGGYSNQKILLQ